jgi:hypothetical protein
MANLCTFVWKPIIAAILFFASISATSAMFMPPCARKVPAVCLKSWKRMCGRPASIRAASK